MGAIPKVMSGVYLTGHGGLEKLIYKEDIPVPVPQSGEVLIEVKGAGVTILILILDWVGIQKK